MQKHFRTLVDRLARNRGRVRAMESDQPVLLQMAGHWPVRFGPWEKPNYSAMIVLIPVHIENTAGTVVSSSQVLDEASIVFHAAR